MVNGKVCLMGLMDENSDHVLQDARETGGGLISGGLTASNIVAQWSILFVFCFTENHF
jgi:hypothetical protein